MKYRKKPVVIEAFRLGYDETPSWIVDGENISLDRFEIDTLEGTMTALRGDYIIKGVKGELYPCKADIFEATYDKV